MSRLSKKNLLNVLPVTGSFLWRIRRVICVLAISLLLSGCVEYDVGTTFHNANSGELVQHIRLGERLTSFSGESVYDWLNDIQSTARHVGGRTKRISEKELIVTIPFSSGHELQGKFNNFFHPNSDKKAKSKSKSKAKSSENKASSEFNQIESNLVLSENNFLLFTREHLTYNLDLSSLGLISNKGNALVNTDSILDLEFALNTPWGAKNIQKSENALQPEKQGDRLVWQLKSGTLNHIEVIFWLPNPFGIGTLLIVLFIVSGIYLRYTLMPDPRIQFSQAKATD